MIPVLRHVGVVRKKEAGRATNGGPHRAQAVQLVNVHALQGIHVFLLQFLLLQVKLKRVIPDAAQVMSLKI